MKLKDLIGISILSVFLFPVVLIGALMAAGMIRLEFGKPEEIEESLLGKTPAQTEAEMKQLKSFQAIETREKAVLVQEEKLKKESERLESLKLETDKSKEEIRQHRKRIEELVGQNQNIQDKKIASLAEVYGAMRAEEAAPILLSLKDSMIVKIMQKVPEPRNASKLMAALAALDVRRAARITELLGKPALEEKKKDLSRGKG